MNWVYIIGFGGGMALLGQCIMLSVNSTLNNGQISVFRGTPHSPRILHFLAVALIACIVYFKTSNWSYLFIALFIVHPLYEMKLWLKFYYDVNLDSKNKKYYYASVFIKYIGFSIFYLGNP